MLGNVLRSLEKDYRSALAQAKLNRRWAKETNNPLKYWKYAFEDLAYAKEFKKAMQILQAQQPNSEPQPQLDKGCVSGRSEQLCDLLLKLKEENMCSVAGDELIDVFMKSHNCL